MKRFTFLHNSKYDNLISNTEKCYLKYDNKLYEVTDCNISKNTTSIFINKNDPSSSIKFSILGYDNWTFEIGLYHNNHLIDTCRLLVKIIFDIPEVDIYLYSRFNSINEKKYNLDPSMEYFNNEYFIKFIRSLWVIK